MSLCVDIILGLFERSYSKGCGHLGFVHGFKSGILFDTIPVCF